MSGKYDRIGRGRASARGSRGRRAARRSSARPRAGTSGTRTTTRSPARPGRRDEPARPLEVRRGPPAARPRLRGVGAVGRVAGERRRARSGRSGRRPRGRPRARRARAVDREVERPPDAEVVERRPPHVEEHPVRSRRRRAVEPSRRAATSAARRSRRAALLNGLATTAQVGARRAGPRRSAPRAVRGVRARDLDPVGEARPGARRRSGRKCGLRTSAPPRLASQRGDPVRARCRAARGRRSSAAGVPAGTT